jgi:mannose-6-phosphate isomerase-like protein (cupin superfamily)
MKACRTASVVAFAALFGAMAIGACREEAPPSAVPGPTTARPATTSEPSERPATIALLDGTTKLAPPACSRLYIAVGKGTANARGETLRAGDVLVILHPAPLEVKVTGLAASVVKEVPCPAGARPAEAKTIIRATEAPELRFAHGTMSAHLDVGAKISPELYLGRLDGSAPVAEHEHASSVETLIALDGAGTFTIDGQEHRLGPRQIVIVPKKTKHSWKPDPGTNLAAIQIYEPPGPEQRFVGLAAAEKDAGPAVPPQAGRDAGPDAAKR